MKSPVLLWFILYGITMSISQGQNMPAPEIRAARQIEFQTVDQTGYLLEGTLDGAAWETVGAPIFGDGELYKATLPESAEAYREWRVRPVNSATLGPAVTDFGGKTLALNDTGQPRQLIFFPKIQGVQRGILKTDSTHARSFVWKVRQTAGAAATVELRYFDGSTSSVELTFASGRLGAYRMRDRDVRGAVQVTEGGGFSLHQGRIRDEPSQSALPLTLDGQSILFEEGGAITVMDFDAYGKVTLQKPDGTTEVLDYFFDRNSPQQASLRLKSEREDIPSQIFNMALNSQATGNFERLPALRTGMPDPAAVPQLGNFSVPSVPVVINSTAGPPKTLDGKVLQLNGDKPVTLTFHIDGTGTATSEENGSVEVTPFTYDYSPMDEDEANLALTFPGADTDRVEEYNLDFGNGGAGSYQSSSYQGGELAQASSGSFNAGGP